MLRIDIYYNKAIIDNEKYFIKTIKDFKKMFPSSFKLHESNIVDFEIKFNKKVIYSLEDSFDCVKSINKEVLLKSKKMLASAIISSKSKVFPPVDDISIDEY